MHYRIAKAGESLVELAVAQGMNTKKLQALNGFDAAHRVQAGEVVYLKAPKKRHYHIVRPGETLAAIAARYGSTAEKLQAKNRLPDTKVLPGQQLSLKKTRPKGSKPVLLDLDLPDAPAAPSPKADLKPPKPTPPAVQPDKGTPSTSTKTHTVASGDTLWGVAKRYNTTVSAIQQLNQLRSESLYVGQKLKIPGSGE